MLTRSTTPLLAKCLSLLSILVLLPLSLSSSGWFLGKTGLSFFGFFDHLPMLDPTFRVWWILYVLVGPLFSLMLLVWSLVLEREKGVSALSTRWKRWSLIGAGLCILPVALGLCIHAIAG